MGPRPDQTAARALRADLARELGWLGSIAVFVDQARARLERSDAPQFDTLALAHGLADFYTLAEKLFEQIARAFEGLPPGPDGHAALLRRMSLDIADERPPVLSEETAKALDGFRRFRHLLRNVYGIRIEPARTLALAEAFPPARAAFEDDMNRFLRFLDVLAAA